MSGALSLLLQINDRLASKRRPEEMQITSGDIDHLLD